MRILMTGGRGPAALGLARMLWKAGHAVFMAESLPFHLNSVSRAVHKNFHVPSPNQNPEAFIDRLRKIIIAEKIDLLIPSNEEIFFIAMFRERLEPYCRLLLEEFDKLDQLHSKWKFNALARKLGIAAPHTERVISRNELYAFAQSGRQLVFKPEYSRFSSRVQICPPSGAWIQGADVSGTNPWVVQEFIPGAQICTYGVAQNGRLVAFCAYETLFTVGAGTNLYFKLYEDPLVFEWVRKFVKLFDFTGQIAFDLIRTETNQYLPIECNPRATNGVFLFETRDGLASALTDKGFPALALATHEDTMLGVPMLLYGFQAVKSASAAKKWISALWHGQGAIFELGDPLPMFSQYISLVERYSAALWRGVSLAEATTADIEWNGVHRRPRE